jgi:IS1 family transposase
MHHESLTTSNPGVPSVDDWIFIAYNLIIVTAIKQSWLDRNIETLQLYQKRMNIACI